MRFLDTSTVAFEQLPEFNSSYSELYFFVFLIMFKRERGAGNACARGRAREHLEQDGKDGEQHEEEKEQPRIRREQEAARASTSQQADDAAEKIRKLRCKETENAAQL